MTAYSDSHDAAESQTLGSETQPAHQHARLSSPSRPRKKYSFPLPFALILSICLGLFMMQPLAPSLFGAPVQVLLLWLLFGLLALFRGRALVNSLSIFSLLQWTSILLLLGFMLARSFLDSSNLLRVAQLVTGIILAVVASMAFQHRTARNTILVTLVLVAMVSAIVSIGQYFELSPYLWEASVYRGQGYIYGATGLETSPVSFGYSILGISVLLLASTVFPVMYRVRHLPLPLPFLLFALVLVVLGLIFSNSRSSLFGFVLAMSILLLPALSRTPVARTLERSRDFLRYQGNQGCSCLLIYAVAVISMSILLYAFFLRGSRSLPLQDARFVETWRAYLPVIWSNPLGVPHGADLVSVLELEPSIQAAFSSRLIAPHNLLLTTGLAFGPIAALALVVLYGTSLVSGLRSFRSWWDVGQISQALWLLALVAANAAIIAHSWFHNASIAMGEMRNWLWLGLLVAGSKNVPVRTRGGQHVATD